MEGAFPDAEGRTIFAGSALFILSATMREDHGPLGFSTARQLQAVLAAYLDRAGVPKARGQAVEESFR